MTISRRDFLKGTLITGAAMSAVPTVLVRRSPAEWAKKTIVHPNIDDLRVVGITDVKMTRAKEIDSSWKRQEELVMTEAVWENIDKLACALAETKEPTDAWKAIFIKPPGKSWSDTTIAIKTNHIAQQHTRSAVMAKVCHVLVEILGVKPVNIYIYDGTHGSNMSRETPFAGLPKGCKVVDQWGGISTPVAVPSPWEGPGGKSEIIRPLVDGTVDILVNLSMCKGHWNTYGGFTMAMKNHLGTFSPTYAHRDGAQEYLLAINQTPEILGRMDKKTGKVLYPRQQLCLLDALWASKGGPSGLPSHQPHFLAMGVFAPVFDYILATRFREDKMGWRPSMSATKRFLTEFGYKENDLPGGGKLIEV